MPIKHPFYFDSLLQLKHLNIMKNLYLVIFGLLILYSLGINGEHLSPHSSRVLLSRIDATHHMLMKVTKAISNKIADKTGKCPTYLKSSFARWKSSLSTADEAVEELRRTVKDMFKAIPKIPSQAERLKKKVIFF